jgi:hypothetical protein
VYVYHLKTSSFSKKVRKKLIGSALLTYSPELKAYLKQGRKSLLLNPALVETRQSVSEFWRWFVYRNWAERV